ncbi:MULTISPECIES: CinA family protein [Methylobacterium]|uniref:CinA family protein n=1 Tax=Methylobacterium TaxID=407 RepID=UPI00036280C3|nr:MULTISPECIES: CinA family protein [Methylobacterium]MBN4095734.1 CinA family protein [Methylobacterium sp. OT2]UIN37253.1 CinA family protein [Methylobacterium oryzae]SEF99355.1 nicotinamide-nucleotide amidase [Methylobacterium sp. 190mf]SEO53115.1 nicotinamide-nucleotide amidase [Methylobacterium sp. UNC300MFChir4.1]
MVDDAELLARAEALVTAYAADGRTVATAESCTGGLVAGLLTAVPGSSAVLERGFVTYSNDAKAEAIGVPIDLIRRHGAVSEPVARAMAAGALAASRASVAVAITGIAGPGGGSAEKPVGLVHFGLSRRDGETRHLERRYGDLGRAGIRRAAVADALGLLEDALGD